MEKQAPQSPRQNVSMEGLGRRVGAGSASPSPSRACAQIYSVPSGQQREKNLSFGTEWYNLSSPPRRQGTWGEEPDGTGRTREPAPGAAGASHAGGTSLGMHPLRDLPGRLCDVPRVLRDQNLAEPGRGSSWQHRGLSRRQLPTDVPLTPVGMPPLRGPAEELQVRLRGCRGDAGAAAKPFPEGQPRSSV